MRKFQKMGFRPNIYAESLYNPNIMSCFNHQGAGDRNWALDYKQ